MNKCKYIISEKNGDFYIEIPSILDSGNTFDLENSFFKYIEESKINTEELLESLKKIEKQLVVPESVNSIIIGQDSLKTVARNFQDYRLKSKFNHLINILNSNWNNSGKNNNQKNPTNTQNIVFCSFDESKDYEYNSELDVIFINTISDVNKENILKASLERTANILGFKGNIKESLLNLNPELLSLLNISNTSPITPSDILSLYFNDSTIKRESIVDFLDVKKDNYIEIKEKYSELSSVNNRDINYEPVNKEFIYNLKPGDLVSISIDKEVNQNLVKNPQSAFYSIFIDYHINGEGNYVIKTISQGSNFPEYRTLESSEIFARKQSIGPKFKNTDIDRTSEYISVKLDNDLYFNNKFLYSMLKRGDKIVIGRADYLVLNVRGSVFDVVNNKNEISELKPGNKIKYVKLSLSEHPNLKYKGENLVNNFEEIFPLSNKDKEYIKENDVVEYDNNKTGIVIYISGPNLYVKNMVNDQIDIVFKNNVSKHFINNVSNDNLILKFKEESKDLINIDPFNYGDYLKSNFNWMPFYKNVNIKRGDYIINKHIPFVVIEENNGLYRVHDGKNYIFLNPENLSDSIIATKRKQDPKLAESSINKNSYYVSNNPGEYDQSYPVKIIYNKNTGETRVVPIATEMKEHYVDKTVEFKEKKGYDKTDTLYAFKKNNINVKNSEYSIPIFDSNKHHQKIFDLLIPGTFIKFSINSTDLKYWQIEKRIGDSFLISHSFYKDGEINTVKKLLNKFDELSEIRLPSYAHSVIKKINERIGIKESKEISTLNIKDNPLKDYDSSEIIYQVAELLENRFNVKINLIHSSDLDQYKDSIDNIDLVKAFVIGGEYYVNIDKASIVDPLHELLHMVLASMKWSNQDEYEKLVNSVKNHPLFEEVSKSYKEVNLDLLEETFIRLFTETVEHKINQQGVFSEEIFDDAVKTAIKNMFDLSVDLKEESSYSLLDMEIREILTSFGSKLIENLEPMYNKSNAQTMMSVSTILRELIKNGNLKEQCNG